MNSETVSLILSFFTIMIGLALGSFITLASHRLAYGEEIIIKPSHCTKCNHRLGIKDLFPVISWLFSKGKCRYCTQAISYRYPLIEIITSIITLFIYKKFGISFLSLIYLLIAICLMIAIITDFEHYIIPDQIQISLAIIAIFYNYTANNINFNIIICSIIAALTGIVLRKIIFVWKKQDPLGIGDIKFLAVSGLFLKIETLPTYFFLSGIIGIITAIYWTFMGKGKVFPFGPALAISMFLCLIYPETNNLFTNAITNLILK